MNIIKYENNKAKLFKDIDSGQCFIYKEELYMSLERTKACYGGFETNSVRLRDGYMAYFSDEQLVTLVEVEVIVH